MKLVFTEQALDSLQELLDFIGPEISHEKLIAIHDRILDKADTLRLNPLKGQKEPFLEHLGLGHRRIIESHFKIIYHFCITIEYILLNTMYEKLLTRNLRDFVYFIIFVYR